MSTARYWQNQKNAYFLLKKQLQKIVELEKYVFNVELLLMVNSIVPTPKSMSHVHKYEKELFSYQNVL